MPAHAVDGALYGMPSDLSGTDIGCPTDEDVRRDGEGERGVEGGGAVVPSRAQQSKDPFDDVAITLSDLVRDVA